MSHLVEGWKWDMFGEGLLIVQPIRKVSLWRRILTRVLLGSTWTYIS